MGDLLLTDKVLIDVTNSKARGRVAAGDSGGSIAPGGPLCSCSGIEVSNDLQVVKVFLSIFTDDMEARQHIMKRCRGLAGCAAMLCILHHVYACCAGPCLCCAAFAVSMFKRPLAL
jgi:hypothetical protein